MRRRVSGAHLIWLCVFFQAEEREALKAKHAEKVAKDKLDLAKDRAAKMERKQRARVRFGFGSPH